MSPAAVKTDPNATVTMQGIVVPASSVQPPAFFAGTRRLQNLEKTIGTWNGFGGTDLVELRKTGILAGVIVKVGGNLVLTPGTGTIATTSKWPYGLLRTARFSANGESNLIQALGWKLKAREIIGRGDLTDRGVVQASGGASPGTSRQQGTLSLASESWGVGQKVTGLLAGTYDVECRYWLPVADDLTTLLGAIFAQTSATSLEVILDWETQANLFTLTGNAALTFTPSIWIETVAFRIPSDGRGGLLLPNLSAFHQFVQNRYTGIANGPNEVTLAGQGVGRQLMRIFWQVWSGSTPSPLALTAGNFTQPYWKYGANDSPETWVDGLDLRYRNEKEYDCDLGGLQGIACIDFANQFAFRDTVDEGAATELRFGFNIPTGVTLTNPYVDYVQETLFGSGLAA